MKNIKSPFVQKEKDPRFSEEEITLLRRLNEASLKLLRKVFYQDTLTTEEQTTLKDVLSLDLIKVLRRFFIQDLDHNEPIFSMPNRWVNPRFDGMLSSEVAPTIIGRQKALKFLSIGMDRLESITKDNFEPLELSVDIRMQKDYKGIELSEVKAEAVAMQDAIAFLESALLSIYSYVIQDPEEIQNMMKRLQKNSSK